ncbi:BON domain-containing protein [Prosthecobacter vanneervenii]|uniref:Osmotically-inducible protein OsmY n=1 Tax=Prosthecobacter vanneervenii TaxID=48466 RepID=A0A7W7YC67_9BACT|nr:BON domain-containing protein [Prosthecobacter vanneervenii]MBB5033415.1 osmotically-inducible protein OsmY [Prosthecobacter vanneervenii]
MTRARWILSAASLFALWLLGALVLLPVMQRTLEAAAKDTLSKQTELKDRLGALQVTFDGQQAHLRGSVRTAQDRNRIEAAVRDLVRAPAPLSGGLGLHLNPVGGVRSEIEIVPYAPGWLLLAANGPRARLLGTAANAYEARDLARSVQDQWDTRGGSTEGMPGTDAEVHDEAASVSTTLRGIPAPSTGAQAWLARIGQGWRQLALQSADATLLSQARDAGVSEEEWKKQVLPALEELRALHLKEQRAELDAERFVRLPPGHLFLAARGQEIILRGEVGSEAMKRTVLEEALQAFSPRRLHDQIRVTTDRRPSGEFGPITTALLPEKDKPGGKTCFLGLAGDAWKPVEWQIAVKEQTWKNDLPGMLDLRELQADSAVVSSWLDGTGGTSPSQPQAMQPAFLSLAVFGSRVILSGQVAEAAAQALCVDAVRRAYSPPFLVMSDSFRVHGDCAASRGILNTLKSLPPAPKAGSAGIFAIARPGGDWEIMLVTQDLVEAGGIARAGKVPAGIPAAVVEELSAEAVEELRLHLAHPEFP